MSLWMSGTTSFPVVSGRCSHHAIITLRTQRRWGMGGWEAPEGRSKAVDSQPHSELQLRTLAQESPGQPYRHRGRPQLQHLIPRLWGVLKFCVVFPLLGFPVPLLPLACDIDKSTHCHSCSLLPLACDLDKSTHCHSCSLRGTIEHLFKSTKYLHPWN